MKPSSALATLRQLSCLDFDGKLVTPALIEALRAYIGFDLSSLVWVNADYRPVDSYTGATRRPDLHAMYLSKFFQELEGDAILSSGALLRSGLPFDNTAVYGKRYVDSNFFKLICRPVDLTHGIRLALRDGDRPLGCLVLGRPPGSKAFGRDDERRAGDALGYLSHALAREGTRSPATKEVAEGAPGLLVMTRQGVVQHISVEADRLLRMLVWRPGLPGSAFVDDYLSLAGHWLKQLARRLQAIDSGSATSQVPVVSVRNRWGNFTLRGFFMHALGKGTPPLLGVSVTRFVPVEVRLLAHPEVQALPPREKAVCLLLAQGRTTSEIAQRLDLSPHTVISHTRSLYNRFCVSSRDALVDHLLGDAPPGIGPGVTTH